MLNSILESASKPRPSDEPMEDWYLEGLEVLENSKRVAELKKRMTQRATQQWGFYFDLLMIAVWTGLGIWRARLESETLLSFVVYGLLLLSFIIRIESASIARIEAAMELTKFLDTTRRQTQEKASILHSPIFLN